MQSYKEETETQFYKSGKMYKPEFSSRFMTISSDGYQELCLHEILPVVSIV